MRSRLQPSLKSRCVIKLLLHVWRTNFSKIERIKGTMSRYFSIFLKKLKVSLHQLNSKNNGLALLLKTILRH